MAHPARFWDRLARRYAASPVKDEAAYQHKLALTRAILRPDMQVLEFGCGTGSTAMALAPHVAQIIATDFSARMLDIARDKAATGGVANIRFEHAAFDALSAPEGGFDVILGHSILHLLADTSAVLAQVYSLLKPGGAFVSSTPCLSEATPVLRLIARPGQAVGLLPRLTFFTAPELEAAVTGAGFSIETRFRPRARGAAVFLIARKPA